MVHAAGIVCYSLFTDKYNLEDTDRSERAPGEEGQSGRQKQAYAG